MNKVRTEFGDFSMEHIGEFSYFYLSHEDKKLLLGWVRSNIDEDREEDAPLTKQKIFDRFVILYVMILRVEIKLELFGKLPLNNPFKDAVLRMQIEKTGQTFEVRKFVEDYNKMYAWRSYPESAELYEIESYLDNYDFVLRCPYGRYVFQESGDNKNFSIERFRNDETSVLSDIYIPYDSVGIYTKKLAAMLQGLDTISNDIHDIVNQKKLEMIKRIAEVVKYIFGYDKLRNALRNRAVS